MDRQAALESRLASLSVVRRPGVRRALVAAVAFGCLQAAAGRAQTPPPAQVAAVLAEARRAYEAQDFAGALPLLDRAIEALQASGDTPAAAMLIEAYEMRARARLSPPWLDWDGARADFSALLARAPRHALPATTSPRILQLFEETRRATIGELVLNVTPAGARMEIDGRPFVPSAEPTALVAGKHVVQAQQPGYRPLTETIEVRPGAPAQTVNLVLERVSSTLAVVTAPSGVEVLVDGIAQGATPPGPPVGAYADHARRHDPEPETLSGPLVIPDMTPGAHVVELRKDCHVTVRRTVAISALDDYLLPPVRLEPAVASVTVTSAVRDARLFINGEPRGGLPAAIQGLCEGQHTFEVRTAHGRFVRELDLSAGQHVDLPAEVKPAFAIVAATGPADALAAIPDLRKVVESTFGSQGTITLHAPAPDTVAGLLAKQNLPADFLAFDRMRRPVSEAAVRIAPYRATISADLARALDVQGLAAITVAPEVEPGRICLILLAAGSTQPDVLDIDLESQESQVRALARLGDEPEFVRPDVGLLVVDIAGVPGAVIAAVAPAGAGSSAGLVPGDIITEAGGEGVGDGRAFEETLQRARPGDELPLTVRRQGQTATQASLRVTRSPRVVVATDRSRLFNKLVLDFGISLAECTDPGLEPVIRLNLGVALMAVGRWADAREMLERVDLPDRPGVSAGTVRYLLGVCAARLGDTAEAARLWRLAADADGALLSEDGPPIRSLAERELAKVRRTAATRPSIQGAAPAVRDPGPAGAAH